MKNLSKMSWQLYLSKSYKILTLNEYNNYDLKKIILKIIKEKHIWREIQEVYKTSMTKIKYQIEV